MNKPLGQKSYGHIPHFSGSRMTPSDKHCELGQQKIMTVKSRDKHDLIVVQEKLDGSNCSIAKINGQIIALTRSGYLAETSPYKQHYIFSEWVNDNHNRFYDLLNEGERIIGEWMILAHGTQYNMSHEPFVVFDIMTGHKRITYHELLFRVLPKQFITPNLLHVGNPLKLDNAKKLITKSGHGAIDPVEGFVYRCERNGNVDFLCKWVRPDKIDGKYLPEVTGEKPVYNQWTQYKDTLMMFDFDN